VDVVFLFCVKTTRISSGPVLFCAPPGHRIDPPFLFFVRLALAGRFVFEQQDESFCGSGRRPELIAPLRIFIDFGECRLFF